MKRIDYESPEAASLQTVTGWVSSNGHFWGKDEHMARYDGSTHRICSKNPGHGKHIKNSWCETCRKETKDAKWLSMPKREYDGSPVVVFDSDTYFFDIDDIVNWLEENDIKPEDAQLSFCKPIYPSQIDPNEHFCDDLPEDCEVSNELQAAFDVLNEVIKAHGPMSWTEGDEAVILPSDILGAA